MTSLETAVNYPRQGEDPWRTVLLGGVLGLLGFLLIPVVFVLGYLDRTLKAAIADDPEPPRFDDWGDLFADGVRMFIVGFVYFLVPTVVFGMAVGGIVLQAALTGDVGLGTVFGALAGFSLSFVLWMAAWYVLPVALANVVYEDRLGVAFAFGDLRPILLSGTYAVAWLLALGLFIVGGIVVSVLSVIPPLGFIAGAFVNFYVAVAAFYLYGRAFTEVIDTDPVPESPAAQPAA